jgi:hypothetical protein
MHQGDDMQISTSWKYGFQQQKTTGRILAIFFIFAAFTRAAYAQATISLPFQDDFEVGDLSLYSALGSVSVTTANPHSGANALSVPPASGTSWAVIRTAATSTLYARVYLFLPSNFQQGTDIQIMFILNNAQFSGRRLKLTHSGGNYYLKLEGGTTGKHPVPLNQWNSVELRVTGQSSGGGNGSASCYLNNVLEATEAGLSNNNPDTVIVAGGTGTVGTMYYDDLAIAAAGPIGGTAGDSGLCLRHANTFARSGLPLLSAFWGWAPTDQLTAEINGTELYRKTGLSTGIDKHPIDLTGLAAGIYTLTVELRDASNITKASWSEAIRKYANGTPNIAIDANNSLSYKGSPLFPVTAFEQNLTCTPPNLDCIQQYASQGYTNMYGWASGYAATFNSSQYGSFIASATSYTGMPSIGPDGRFCNSSNKPCQVVTASDGPDYTDALVLAGNYVSSLALSPRIFGWAWGDEPDAGSLVTVAREMQLMNVAHSNDSLHPVWLNLYGYNVGFTRAKQFFYPNLAAEVYAFDVYPFITKSVCPSWHQTTGTSTYPCTMNNWVNLLDQFQAYNYGLTPWMTFIEAGIQPCSNPPVCTGGKGPSTAQMKMEAWLAVIHGMKGISWWGPEGSFTYVDSAHHAQMATFVDQIGRLKDVVLSAVPSRSLSHNSTTAGNRVDAMVREDGQNVWVFAARVTEATETSTLTTQFTVSGLAGSASVSVFDEGRNLKAVNGVYTDTFAPDAVHIYQIEKKAVASPGNLQIVVR